MLQIGAVLFYYKLGQTLLPLGTASLLQIRARVVTDWGRYYKLRQPLLQNSAAIINWGKIYYELGQVLQIRTIIKNWCITPSMSKFIYHLTYMLLKASITRNEINQAFFISVKTIIYLKPNLLITTSKLISFRDVVANLASLTLTFV